MLGWWSLMGAVIVTGMAVTPRFLRRHRRRAQVDRARAALSAWLPALNQPGGATVPEPPTEDNLSRTASPRQVAQAGCAARPRHRVAPSDPTLSATLTPRRAA